MTLSSVKDANAKQIPMNISKKARKYTESIKCEVISTERSTEIYSKVHI